MEWWKLPVINWQTSPWAAVLMAKLAAGVPVLMILAAGKKTE